MSKIRCTIDVHRDRLTGGTQVSVNEVDEDGHGGGYRLAGPKYSGNSDTVISHVLSRRDIDELRRFLDRAEANL